MLEPSQKITPRKKHILIADFGRSGQGWLSYMLSYILNAQYIEPYDFLRGQLYDDSQFIIDSTQGFLPNREFSKYSLIIKTHECPAFEINLTDKVIYLTRDPRDVAVSGYFRTKVLLEKKIFFSFKGKLKIWLKTIKPISFLVTAIGWKKHAKAWDHIPAYRVKYEDLSSSPLETLMGILSYLDIKVSEKLLQETIDLFTFEKLSGRKKGIEDKKNQVRRKGIVGDYKNHFTSMELRIFWYICGTMVEKLGYLKSL